MKPVEREAPRRLRRDEGPIVASRWRRNVLVYATVSVTVNSTAIVQSIYGAIQEYAGIERPEWVDGRLPSVAPP